MGEQCYLQDVRELNETAHAIWNNIASFWDEKMGEGNSFHLVLVGPSAERLLNVQAGEFILEIGCGNGTFARRLAHLGAKVLATDFSEIFLQLAKARTIENSDKIEYRLVDAVDERALLALGVQLYDAVVCNMAIMDMATIDPLMRAIPQLLKPGGRFVFSVMHPCFNKSGSQLMARIEYQDGEEKVVHSVSVSNYLDHKPQLGVGMPGQPQPHMYFHRPLHTLLNAGFQAGLCMDGIEEPASEIGSRIPDRVVGWLNCSYIPAVMVIRMKRAFNLTP